MPSKCGHDTLTLTSDNKVKETLFVVSTSLLSLQPLSVCHVGQHVLHKEWLEACGGVRAVAGGRSVVEHRVNLVDSPWTTTNTPRCTGLKLSRILLPESSSTSTGKLWPQLFSLCDNRITHYLVGKWAYTVLQFNLLKTFQKNSKPICLKLLFHHEFMAVPRSSGNFYLSLSLFMIMPNDFEFSRLLYMCCNYYYYLCKCSCTGLPIGTANNLARLLSQYLLI